jgi:hypothetical protein
MASDTQETLYKIFAGLAGGSVSGASGSGGGLGGGAIGSAISAATGEQKANGGGAGEIALKIVKSGLGTVPLVAALLGLFGGGEEEKPAPLVKYAMPERREFQAAATASGFAEVDYDQTGMPRVYERRVGEAGIATATGREAAGALPPITVNVQAMDARSFLDRSSEIAAAVREAMLNLNSINDVVTDL